MCAMMMISIEKNVGRPTCRAAASIRPFTLTGSLACFSSAILRNTFSTTITAPSTMIPKSIAPSDSRFAGIPLMVSPMNVAISESGISAATMVAERRFPRNRNSTSITSRAPSARFLNTVCSVVSISHVRS